MKNKIVVPPLISGQQLELLHLWQINCSLSSQIPESFSSYLYIFLPFYPLSFSFLLSSLALVSSISLPAQLFFSIYCSRSVTLKLGFPLLLLVLGISSFYFLDFPSKFSLAEFPILLFMNQISSLLHVLLLFFMCS